MGCITPWEPHHQSSQGKTTFFYVTKHHFGKADGGQYGRHLSKDYPLWDKLFIEEDILDIERKAGFLYFNI